LIEKGTYAHVQECIGARVDLAIKQGQWQEAANHIVEVEEKCLGHRVGAIRRELGEELRARELAERDRIDRRERERKRFTDRSGQWAHWRYYASGVT
jgi:hypothetical protein